jgi:hypothetical protein
MTEGGQGTPALYRRIDGIWGPWEDSTLGAGEAGTSYFKVHGTQADDLWIVGDHGVALHWDGVALVRVATDTDVDTSTAPLLTVHTGGEFPIAVGGLGNGVVLEYQDGAWHDATPQFQPGLNGVCASSTKAWSVGLSGSRAARADDGSWSTDADSDLLPVTVQDWHGCAIDADGGLWMVGGAIASRPLTHGVVGYEGNGDAPEVVLE